MTPSRVVAILDRHLLLHGEDVLLGRLVGGVGFQIGCRAFVRGVSAEQIVGTITQADIAITISPSQIVAAEWPQGDVAVGIVDKRIPRINDFAIVQGKQRQVKNAKPIFVGGVWVRCDMVVAG